MPEITDDDAMVLRMLAGATFSNDATLVLPSGLRLDAATANEWVKAHEEMWRDV